MIFSFVFENNPLLALFSLDALCVGYEMKTPVRALFSHRLPLRGALLQDLERHHFGCLKLAASPTSVCSCSRLQFRSWTAFNRPSCVSDRHTGNEASSPNVRRFNDPRPSQASPGLTRPGPLDVPAFLRSAFLLSLFSAADSFAQATAAEQYSPAGKPKGREIRCS